MALSPSSRHAPDAIGAPALRFRRRSWRRGLGLHGPQLTSLSGRRTREADPYSPDVYLFKQSLVLLSPVRWVLRTRWSRSNAYLPLLAQYQPSRRRDICDMAVFTPRRTYLASGLGAGPLHATLRRQVEVRCGRSASTNPLGKNNDRRLLPASRTPCVCDRMVPGDSAEEWRLREFTLPVFTNSNEYCMDVGASSLFSSAWLATAKAIFRLLLALEQEKEFRLS